MFRKTVEMDDMFSKFVSHIEAVSLRRRHMELPSGKICVAVRRLLKTRCFVAMSMSCVCINIGFLLSDHADKSASFQQMLATQNMVFFLELVVEVILGFVGYGLRSYMMVSYHLFSL